MSYFLDFHNCLDRLRKEWLQHKGIIIALDVDSTLIPYRDYEQGHREFEIADLIRKAHSLGCKVIIWTAAESTRHIKIVEWLAENKVPWDKFNEDIDGITYGTRKVYANLFIDDRAGLGQTVDMLKILVHEFSYNNTTV